MCEIVSFLSSSGNINNCIKKELLLNSDNINNSSGKIFNFPVIFSSNDCTILGIDLEAMKARGEGYKWTNFLCDLCIEFHQLELPFANKLTQAIFPNIHEYIRNNKLVYDNKSATLFIESKNTFETTSSSSPPLSDTSKTLMNVSNFSETNLNIPDNTTFPIYLSKSANVVKFLTSINTTAKGDNEKENDGKSSTLLSLINPELKEESSDLSSSPSFDLYYSTRENPDAFAYRFTSKMFKLLQEFEAAFTEALEKEREHNAAEEARPPTPLPPAPTYDEDGNEITPKLKKKKKQIRLEKEERKRDIERFQAVLDAQYKAEQLKRRTENIRRAHALKIIHKF